MEERKLVLDTMSNGTVIDYNYNNSSRLIETQTDEDTVSYYHGRYEGLYGEDQICLDYSEDTCLNRFSFLIPQWSIFKKEEHRTKINGVFGINRFGMPDKQLVQQLYDVGVFWSSTLQLDLNSAD